MINSINSVFSKYLTNTEMVKQKRLLTVQVKERMKNQRIDCLSFNFNIIFFGQQVTSQFFTPSLLKPGNPALEILRLLAITMVGICKAFVRSFPSGQPKRDRKTIRTPNAGTCRRWAIGTTGKKTPKNVAYSLIDDRHWLSWQKRPSIKPHVEEELVLV